MPEYYEPKSMMRFYVIILAIAVGMLALMAVVSGAPTTGSVTNITGNEATFHATGYGTDGWFEWGAIPGGYYHWTTINQTYSGSFSDTQFGSPMLTGETYYVRACDETGCGNQITWVVPEATLPNRTSYGIGLINTLRSGFNMSVLMPALVAPYVQTFPGSSPENPNAGAPAMWMILFLFILTGYWLRPREIFFPCLLAMVFGGLLWIPTAVAGIPPPLGLPPEAMYVGQGLMYAAIAGMAVSWFMK